MSSFTTEEKRPDERPRLEMIAFAAWVNVPPDKIPPEFRAPTCAHTMAAWKRVADAIEADVFERLRTPSETVLDAGWSGFENAVRKKKPWHEVMASALHGALTAFQQENSDA